MKKPISDEDNEEFQAKKAEQDFRYDTCQKLQNLHRAIEDLYVQLRQCIATQGSDHIRLDAKMDRTLDQLGSIVKQQTQRIETLELQIQKQKMEFAEVLSNLGKSATRKEDLQHAFLLLGDSLEKLRKEFETMQTNMNRNSLSQLAAYESSLRAFKHDMTSKPDPIPALRKEFDDKLELVTLNGTNSILRSTNNEKQISLVEKKIEQINLILKQHELNRQQP